MNELRTSIVVDLAGNLVSRAQAMSASIAQFGERTAHHLREAGGALGHLTGMLSSFGGAWGELALGAGAAIAAERLVHSSLTVEERLERLGVLLGRTKEQMRGLREEVHHLATDPAIRVAPEELMSALEQIKRRGGDVTQALQQGRLIAATIQAAGGPGMGPVIGNLVAGLQGAGLSGEEQGKALEEFRAKAPSGFGLQAAAQYFPQVLDAYQTATGREGYGAVKEAIDLMAVITKHAGGPEKAAMSVQSLLFTLQDKDKLKTLQEAGIRTHEKNTDGEVVMRPVLDVLEDFIVRAEKSKLGREQGLGTVVKEFFDRRAERALKGLELDYKRTGAFPEAERLRDLHGAPGGIEAASARIAATHIAKVQNLGEKILTGAQDTVLGVLDNPGMLIEGQLRLRDEFKRGQWGKLLIDFLTQGAGGLDIEALQRSRGESSTEAPRSNIPALAPEGRILIEFKNAPADLRVRKIEARGLGLDVDTGTILQGH